MIFSKIFRSEFSYQIRRITIWLYLLVLLAFTIGLSLTITTNDGVYVNNTFLITATTVLGGLIWLLIGATVAGEASARDVRMRIHPLVYTTPITTISYLGGKFLAAFAVNALLILSLPLGLLISFYLPGLVNMEQGNLLAFRPEVYLNIYFFIALPTAFIGTALQFSFSTLSRKVMTSYIAGFLLAIFPQIIAISAANFFGNPDLTKLLDPVGVAGIIGNEMQTWTINEKNTRLLSPEGMFLWNRILWLSIASGSLLLTWFRFNFANPENNSLWNRFLKRKKVETSTFSETRIFRKGSIAVSQVEQDYGFTTGVRQMIHIGWTSFVEIVRHPLGVAIVGVMALTSAIFGDLIINNLGIPLLPTSQQVLDYLAAPVNNVSSPWVTIPLLIIYFTGELVWQERDAGLNDVADTTPVRDWTLFTGKFLGIILIIFVWLALLMAGGILMQLYLGYNHLEIELYLQVLFGIQFLEYILFALLVLVVHVVVNQKYIGFLVVLLIYSFMAFPSKFGIEHNILIFGADPGWSYSDMRGFGTSLGPWLLFQLYWLSWALLLGFAARLLWVRGREQSLKNRLQLAKHSFNGSAKWAIIICTGLLIAVGSFIFYNTNLLNDYKTTSDIIELKAEYERRFGQYRNTPQPQLTATKLKVELYPELEKAEIKGTYTLVNKDSLTIDSIHIGNVSGQSFGEVVFNRPAAKVLIDKDLNHHIYALEKPLMPGDSLQLNFSVDYNPKGFSNYGSTSLVIENGTYFTNMDLLPSIGYQHFREIKDASTRNKQKLATKPELPSLFDSEASKKPISTDQSTFEAIIGTVKNEIAVAPGLLIKQWTEGDRSYFHYKTDTSIGAEYSILSADYMIKEIKWKEVPIRIYYHHDQNIDLMLGSAGVALEYYSEQFGPYPYKYLTLIERAGPGSGGTADAGIIYYGEQYPLLNADNSPDGLNLSYYILAHEVGHQWWGLARLTPAYVEGAGVLIEGLSVYSGMQVLEKTYGEGQLRNYIDYLHNSYALPRSLASASLLQANEEFLYYRKGGLAMYSLSKFVGKDKVNAALRNLLKKRTSGKLSTPTTLDLYHELRKVSPDSLNYLLTDLFKENTYWRLKTRQFSANQTQAGDWKVSLKVQAQKIIVDKTGKETEIPMNDWLEIGLYGPDYDLNDPIYLEWHRIQSGEQTIEISLDRKPSRGGIDPNNLLIDLRRDDNMMQLD